MRRKTKRTRVVYGKLPASDPRVKLLKKLAREIRGLEFYGFLPDGFLPDGFIACNFNRGSLFLRIGNRAEWDAAGRLGGSGFGMCGSWKITMQPKRLELENPLREPPPSRPKGTR